MPCIRPRHEEHRLPERANLAGDWRRLEQQGVCDPGAASAGCRGALRARNVMQRQRECEPHLSSIAMATCSSSLKPCTKSSRARAFTSSAGGSGGSVLGGGGVGLSPNSPAEPSGEKKSVGKSGGGGGGSSRSSSSDDANSMPEGTGGGAGVEYLPTVLNISCGRNEREGRRGDAGRGTRPKQL
jgi:hypothetical protein